MIFIILFLIMVIVGLIKFFLNKIELLEEELLYLNNELDIVTNNIVNTLANMRKIDTSGHFESDDEVGVIFNLLQQILIENLGVTEIENETNEENEI